MRVLFPTSETNNKILPSAADKPVTQEQYEQLVEQINCYQDELTTAIGNFDQWKNDIQTAFNTCTLTTDNLNAITATIQDAITATTVQATTVQASNAVFASHFQGTTAYMQCLTTACNVCTPTVNADNVNATCVNTSCIITDDITVNNAVNYNNTNTACATITNADVSCATITDASIHEAAVFCLDADTVQACTGCIETAHITDADIANQLDTYKFTAEFIKHNKGAQAQTLVTPADFYIELPYFANGSYRLISKDSNENELWSITVRNESTNNYVITWSSNEALTNYLEDLYIYQNKFYFHGNSNGKAQTIYHISDTLENELDPTIYTDGWPFDTTSLDVQKYWVFQFAHGTKFFRNVSFANDTAITSPLRLINCDDVECANLPKTYDTTEDTNVVLYQPDQNLNTTSCVLFNRITTADYTDPDTGVTSTSLACHPHLEVTEDITAPSLNVSCTCIDKTTVPNGLVIDCEGTFIKSTGEDTCDYVNPIATFKADECWECADDGLVAYDKNTNSLKPADDVHIVGNLTVECVLTACGPVIACQDVTVTCDLHVNGDAYVSGTLHTVDHETITSTSDNVILRENNSSALASGQYSGIIVNNYDGNGNVVAMVSDCTGTVRVGTGSTTETTYNNIYYGKADNKWYTDEALTTEVTPSGELTAWGSIDDTDDYKHYTNAIFSVINYSNTEPLATRSESSCMCDASIVVWDSACTCVKTSTPSCAGMVYQSCVDSVTGCMSMEWVSNENVRYCRYATMTDFEADKANIQDGMVVYIDDQTNYVYSEER